MIKSLIYFSIKNKIIIIAAALGLLLWGISSLQKLPLDAIPDVTSSQVVVATISPNLSAIEMEQFVTYPIEIIMANLQGKESIRSVSQFGLSLVTIEFKEGTDILKARNQVSERLIQVREEIPSGFGSPQMLPITTGLGEIYQYTIRPENPKDMRWSAMELRTLQDWTVKKQLLSVEGVAEISSFGGYLKQCHIKIYPNLLKATNTTLEEVFAAVEKGNNNTGAAYIEKDANNYFIRGIGLAAEKEDFNNIFIKNNAGVPVLVSDVARIEYGSAIRYGALTQGKSEAVGGIILMLKGENSRQVIQNIKARLELVKQSLPKGLTIEAFLDRELLIDRTIHTVSKNLIEGGLIVVFVLVLLLGHFRAGLIVASVIPLAMLFAIGLMVSFGVSGNLMSLGAIDFGLIVDGAVIIVENIVRRLGHDHIKDKDEAVYDASSQMVQSSIFGQFIILIVYFPLLTLTGIEGKMFKPMALTVIFALVGAVILSLTYVPAMSALFLKAEKEHGRSLADKIMGALEKIYLPVLNFALKAKMLLLGIGMALLLVAYLIFRNTGSEFIPQLDEGDFVVQINMLPGTSLSQMVKMAQNVSGLLAQNFPDEIKLCTSKIGTSEVPMDPMSVEEMDLVLTMHDREQWKKAKDRQDFEIQLDKILASVPGIFTSIQQPISMRFNELMTGAKTDVIVKILGNDLDKLSDIGNEIVKNINGIEGATDIGIAKAEGLPQLFITYDRDAMKRYGVNIESVSNLLQTAIAGKKAGILFEGNQRLDVVVKMQIDSLNKMREIENLLVTNNQGEQVPLTSVTSIAIKNGPMAVQREEGERNVNVNLNVRGRDIASVVADVQRTIEQKVKIPEGYRVTYGGQFENLQNAQKRLAIVVPVALLLILLLLYLSFNSIKESLLIFSAIPFAAVGGIFALWLRDMPFSISAGVGFIALFGVAVLNGMVLIGYFKQLEKAGFYDVYQRVREGVMGRFRPVVMTAMVASLGFLPMAFGGGAGAEVQRPLATVVIGGLITSTFLTLVLLPAIYTLVFTNGSTKKANTNDQQTESEPNDRPQNNADGKVYVILLALFSISTVLTAQNGLSQQEAIKVALRNHPDMKKAENVINRANLLLPSAKNLSNMEVFGESPDQNNANYLNFGINQLFELPKVYAQNKRVLEQERSVAEAEKRASAFEIERMTQELYQNALFAAEKTLYLRIQDSLLSQFNRIAQVEYKTGNISSLDKLNIETRYREVNHQYLVAQKDRQNALLTLKTFLKISENIVLSDVFQPLKAPTSNGLDNNLPMLAYWQQYVGLMQAKQIQQQNALSPSFNTGISQQFLPNGKYVLPVFRLGLNLPVWKKSLRAKVDGARLDAEIAQNQADIARQALMVAYQKAYNDYELAKMNLNYYNETALPQADAILKAASKTYRLGDITAFQYLISTQQAYQIRQEYLNILKFYNQTVIELYRYSTKNEN